MALSLTLQALVCQSFKDTQVVRDNLAMLNVSAIVLCLRGHGDVGLFRIIAVLVQKRTGLKEMEQINDLKTF